MCKRNVGELALFGGAPLLDSPVAIGQLSAPQVDDFIAKLRDIYEKRRLSNDGPFLLALERALAAYHGTRHCIATTNASIGIVMLLQILSAGKPGEVIVPAFGFKGLPHFVRWAGLTPIYCDIEARSHGLDPEAVARAINSRTRAIVPVCNFNGPGPLDILLRLAGNRGIPVIVDSVDGVGATFQGTPMGSFGLAEVFSLHATKLINGFEGGYVTTNDDDIANALMLQRNFGIPTGGAHRSAKNESLLGLNAKLNELHAVMALLSLERVDDIIAANRRRWLAYAEAFQGLPGLRLVAYPPDEKSAYRLVVVEIHPDWPLSRDATVALLRAEGILALPYFSPPLHRSPYCPTPSPMPSLPVTDELSGKMMQMPSGENVTDAAISAAAALLHFTARNAMAIHDALRSRGAHG
jgi:dTDP-4-amino-4,6-dideoxyglucose